LSFWDGKKRKQIVSCLECSEQFNLPCPKIVCVSRSLLRPVTMRRTLNKMLQPHCYPLHPASKLPYLLEPTTAVVCWHQAVQRAQSQRPSQKDPGSSRCNLRLALQNQLKEHKNHWRLANLLYGRRPALMANWRRQRLASAQAVAQQPSLQWGEALDRQLSLPKSWSRLWSKTDPCPRGWVQNVEFFQFLSVSKIGLKIIESILFAFWLMIKAKFPKQIFPNYPLTRSLNIFLDYLNKWPNIKL